MSQSSESVNRVSGGSRTQQTTDYVLTQRLGHLPEITSSSVTRTRTYEERICAQCKQPFPRRHGEAHTRYANRQYCSLQCSGKAGGGKRGNPNPHERRDYVIGEVLHIIGTDNPENIARRLGYVNTNGLMTSLRKWDRHDLAERLVAA